MIKVDHLTKCYGDFLAVDDLSFEIGEGHVYGFLGPNGAGKSTTMNIMTGCLSATSGSVKINGYDIFSQADQAKKLLGYLPEQPPLYMNETPVEYLRFVGEAKGLRSSELRAQIEEVIALTKIEDMCHKRISALSKGYKQRVGIAQALLGKPRVIILDEPTVGLDPLQIIEIRDLIKELGREHTVIFSSHILSEVQTICDQILMIAKGKLIAFDNPENLERNLLSSNEISFVTEANTKEIYELIHDIKHITNIKTEDRSNGLIEVQLKLDAEDAYTVSKELFFLFAEEKKALLEMSVKKANLEEIFIELAGNDQTQDGKTDITNDGPDASGDFESANEEREEEKE